MGEKKVLHVKYIKRKKNLSGWKKKETEGLLLATQDQALLNRNYKVAVIKEQGNKKYQMYNAKKTKLLWWVWEASTRRIKKTTWPCGIDNPLGIVWKSRASEERKLVQPSSRISTGKWQHKTLRNFNIHTDRVIETRRPDIMVVDKCNAETTVIDIAVHCD